MSKRVEIIVIERGSKECRCLLMQAFASDGGGIDLWDYEDEDSSPFRCEHGSVVRALCPEDVPDDVAVETLGLSAEDFDRLAKPTYGLLPGERTNRMRKLAAFLRKRLGTE